MVEPSSFYVRLADREGFNSSVRHINRTLDLLDSSNTRKNIADEINSLIGDKGLDSSEVQSVINMLLVEKWKYMAVSRNISALTDSPASIAEETSKWKAIDLVIGYHHPDLGFTVMNPKNPDSAALIAGFRKNELVVLYAGCLDEDKNTGKNATLALSLLADLIEGRTVKTPASLVSGPYAFSAPKKAAPAKAAGGKAKSSRSAPAHAPGRAAVKATSATVFTSPDAAASVAAAAPVAARAPAPAPVAAVPGQSKMSPLISVVVSNELFHNGNVEAWKRIIRSYNAKYPNLQVFIYYDGERIVDINTLFKWGKVKHGSCIQFTVAGENTQDLAKLSRYFRQGASPQFEAFLHGSPDTVMNLF